MNQVQEELAHSGVLGMKWGVRRARYEEARKNKVKELADKDKKIVDARAKDRKLKADVKTAKVAYKKATLDDGKKEAYAALLAMKDVRMSNLKIANQRTQTEQMMDMAVTASRRQGSLGITGGTNPFMFG